MITEQEISTKLDELISLVSEGKPMEAFAKFYHPDLEKADLDGIVHKGKQENERIGFELLSKVKHVRDFTAVGKVIKGNRSFLVWSLDFDHADQGKIAVTQVAIQDWKDGLIVRERFIA
jgi:hypothetical protein